jgi:hypothetical protein
MQRHSEASLRALLNRAFTRTLGSGPLHTAAFEDIHDAKLPGDVMEVTSRNILLLHHELTTRQDSRRPGVALLLRPTGRVSPA